MNRCKEMLSKAGCELSGALIIMTINTNGRPTEPSCDYQKGIDAINASLDNRQPIILHVDYKSGTSSSLDTAGDHFIIVVGKAIINDTTYYHFYDPATSSIDVGTRGTNVLYVNDGYLTGFFLQRNNETHKKYTVTSVRLNK